MKQLIVSMEAKMWIEAFQFSSAIRSTRLRFLPSTSHPLIVLMIPVLINKNTTMYVKSQHPEFSCPTAELGICRKKTLGQDATSKSCVSQRVLKVTCAPSIGLCASPLHHIESSQHPVITCFNPSKGPHHGKPLSPKSPLRTCT